MTFLDKLFSTEGAVSRKQYFVFFLIFTVLLTFVIFFELTLFGFLYLSIEERILGNYHFLFFPMLLLFLFLLLVITLFFITYICTSIRRAKDFSENPVQYVIYYTSLIITLGSIAMLGRVLPIWKSALIIYFVAFIPYLFFKTDKKSD